MLKNILKFAFIILILCSHVGVMSQKIAENYPVTANAFIKAQADQRLSGYFQNSTALTVDLLLKDLTKTTLQVYLKFSLEGAGVRVFTQDGYVPSSYITLPRGVIYRLHGTDLGSNYFSAGALSAEGIDEGNIFNANLPEGFYTFKVQALEAGTGREVSNIAEAYFVVNTPLPPIITIPMNGSQVPANSLQRLPISWTPRHYATAGSVTTYDLKVCKILDGQEPQEAMENQPVISVQATSATTYPSNTGTTNVIGELEEGAKYAIQVIVHEIGADGQEITFVNQGKSEVVWFQYGKPCGIPALPTVTDIGNNRVNISWGEIDGAKSYEVRYRSVGVPMQGVAEWDSVAAIGTNTVLNQLIAGSSSVYEFQVATHCSSTQSGYSDIATWKPTTNTLDPRTQQLINEVQAVLHPEKIQVNASLDGKTTTTISLTDVLTNKKVPCQAQVATAYACSPSLPNVSPSGSEELTTLKVGDILAIYDYQVVVTQTNDSSPFSGKGLAKIPMMDTYVSVKFSGVKAKKDATAPDGGCVYEVGDYFKTENVSADAIVRQEANLINTMIQNSPSGGGGASYQGAFKEAIDRYNVTRNTIGTNTPTKAQKDSLYLYTVATEKGFATWKGGFDTLFPTNGSNAPSGGWGAIILGKIEAINNDFSSVVSALATNAPIIKAGNGVPTYPNLPQKYEEILAKIKDLFQLTGTPTTPTDPTGPVDPTKPIVDTTTPSIGNLVASNITANSSTLTWKPTGTFTKYVVTYQREGVGEQVITVTSPQVNLTELQADTKYQVKIEGYKGDMKVASISGEFKTTTNTLPPPKNLRYKVLSDNSVKVSWDKDPLHETSTFSYKDKVGVIHDFPNLIGNSVTLTDIDLKQIYPYQVTGNSKTLTSTPAQSQIKTLRCLFDIQGNTTILEGESTILYSSCDGTSSWVNADTESILSNENSVSLSPAITTNYNVTCLSTNIKTNKEEEECVKALKITVIPKCGIEAIASRTSIEYGVPVSLSVTGCNGIINWSDNINGLNSIGASSTLFIYPTVSKKYFAICTQSDGTICATKTEIVNVKSNCNIFKLVTNNPVVNSINLDPLDALGPWSWKPEGLWEGIGTVVAGVVWTTVGGIIDGVLDIFGLLSNSSGQKTVGIYASGCENVISWNKNNNDIRIIASGKNYIGITNMPENGYTINATCNNGCKAQIHSTPPSNKQCNNFTIKPDFSKTSLNNPYVTLQALEGSIDKTSEVSWGGGVISENNGALIKIPFPPTLPKVYTAYSKDFCEASYILEPTPDKNGMLPTPLPPTIPCPTNSLAISTTATCGIGTDGRKVIMQGDNLTLTATGCSNGQVSGTISWLKDNQTTSTGISNNVLAITNSPVGTHTYRANCTVEGKLYSYKDVKVSTETPMKVDVSPKEISYTKALEQNTNVTLTASGCTSGVITWSQFNGEILNPKTVTLDTHGNIITVPATHNIFPSGSSDASPIQYNYTASCSVCNQKAYGIVNIGPKPNTPPVTPSTNPCDFSVSVFPENIYPNNPVKLSAFGCSDATWWGDNNKVYRGKELSLNDIDRTTSFQVMCVNSNGSGLCTKDNVLVLVDNSHTTPTIPRQCTYYKGTYEKDFNEPASIGSSANQNEYDGNKKVAAVIHYSDGKLILLDSYCTNMAGISTWYQDNNRTFEVVGDYRESNNITILKMPTETTFYYGTCSIVGGVCKNITLKVIPPRTTIGILNASVLPAISYYDAVVTPSTNTSARTDATSSANPCDGYVLTKTAMQAYLKDLLCEKIQAFGETRTPRTDKSITKEDATAFLTALKNAIFDELGVELPPITDDMIANLTGENYSRTGGCGGVVNALTENLTGYLPVDKVNQGYENVVKETVENAESCTAPKPTIAGKDGDKQITKGYHIRTCKECDVEDCQKYWVYNMNGTNISKDWHLKKEYTRAEYTGKTGAIDAPYSLTGGDPKYFNNTPTEKLGTYTTPDANKFFGNDPTDSKSRYVNTGNQFILTNENYFSTEQDLVNQLLGDFISCTGPENIVFPHNGKFANILKNSIAVGEVISSWSKKNFDTTSPYTWRMDLRGELNVDVNSGFTSLEHFLGSVGIRINLQDRNNVKFELFNITSFTSGFLIKDLPLVNKLVDSPNSTVRNSSNKYTYSNISQYVSFTLTPTEINKLINQFCNGTNCKTYKP